MNRTPDEIKKGLAWDEVDKALQKVRFADDNESDTRKPKPSVDIKTALEVCKYGCQQCYRCGYGNILSGDEENDEICEDALKTDALALIQQLETDKQQLEGMLHHMNQLRDAAAGRALKMEERVHQLEAELDAAVACIPRECGYCKHDGTADFDVDSVCDYCLNGNTRWEWRGVQKEE